MSRCPQCSEPFTAAESPRFCTNCGSPLAVGAAPESARPATAARLPDDPHCLRAIRATLFVTSPAGAQILSDLFASRRIEPAGIVQATPQQLAQQAHAELTRLHQRRAVKYVCLFGDWTQVPAYVYTNPADDQDETCLVDAPYGSLEPFDPEVLTNLIPQFPVGRIPLVDAALAQRLLLGTAAGAGTRGALSLSVTAERWMNATRQIVTQVATNESFEVSTQPGAAAAAARTTILSSPEWVKENVRPQVAGLPETARSLLHFNVHGADTVTDWFGHSSTDADHVPAVVGTDTALDLEDAVLVTEACYGGKLGYAGEPGMAESFFLRGGRIFIGCSVIAYGNGGPYGSIQAADILAQQVLSDLREGREAGACLTRAREALERDFMESPEASLEPGPVEKTMMSFNLYGAPWDQVSPGAGRSGASASRAGRPAASLDDIRARLAERASSDSLIGSIRERYMRRLSERARRFVLDRQEAQQRLATFRDRARLEDALAGYGLDPDHCTITLVEIGARKGYTIKGQGRSAGLSVDVVMSLDEQGRITSEVTSKPFSPAAVSFASAIAATEAGIDTPAPSSAPDVSKT